MSKNRSRIGNRRYKQGHYVIQYPEKYLGSYPILYRSSWEKAFCRYCDLNENVKKWSAEGIEIPYKITNDKNQVETHRYYPDFYLEMTKNDNKESYERILVEIKPKAECTLPEKPKKHTLKMLENYEYALRTHKKNLHKWAFTREWCERKGIKFIIITEDHLRKKGLIP